MHDGILEPDRSPRNEFLIHDITGRSGKYIASNVILRGRRDTKFNS